MSFNIPEFTVTQFSRTIKRVVEDAFRYVRIKGEITGFKKATSGHLYFSLKDETANLSAVCFRNMANLINFEMADGLEVTVSGKVTTFEGRSNYQIIVEKVEISGIGAILEMIEKRKQKLSAEGLFDAIHKQKIPFFPKLIGVITSETGAVLQDIKHRIEARCPSHIMLYPTLVQGDKAASQVIQAIAYFNKLKNEQRPDVLIVARGGGSFEDLLPFNDELLVREVFASNIPIISAIGHETDTSLIDYVSDLRAPTPSAAAELATPVLAELKNQLTFLEEKLTLLPQHNLAEKLRHLTNLQKYIVDPVKMLQQICDKFTSLAKTFTHAGTNLLNNKSQKLASLQLSKDGILNKVKLSEQRHNFLTNALHNSFNNSLKEKQSMLNGLTKLLKAHHYHEILKRGFAFIKTDKGDLIASLSQLKPKQKIITQMYDGEFSSYVLDVSDTSSQANIKNKNAVTDNVQPKLI